MFPPVPLLTNRNKYVEQPFNSSDLTSRYTTLTQELIYRFAEGQGAITTETMKQLLKQKHSSNSNSNSNSLSLLEELQELFGDSGEDFTTLQYDKPFFLHIGYENPHVPLFTSDSYDGNSRR